MIAEDRRMDATQAAEWAGLVADALLAGRVRPAFGEESAKRLEGDGFVQLAETLRGVVARKSQLLLSRGFTSASRVGG